jgi:hypothetical protein
MLPSLSPVFLFCQPAFFLSVLQSSLPPILTAWFSVLPATILIACSKVLHVAILSASLQICLPPFELSFLHFCLLLSVLTFKKLCLPPPSQLIPSSACHNPHCLLHVQYSSACHYQPVLQFCLPLSLVGCYKVLPAAILLVLLLFLPPFERLEFHRFKFEARICSFIGDLDFEFYKELI